VKASDHCLFAAARDFRYIRRRTDPASEQVYEVGMLIQRVGVTLIARQGLMDPLSAFRERFGAPRALVGMLHVGALPGTPAARHSIDRLIEHTVAEARIYRDAGFTALALENMHDRPYLKGGVGPEVTAAMTVVAREVKRETGLVLGIQVLAAANREALAIALACGAEFVRVEGFVFAHVADEGVIQSCAGELLRYRRTIGADRVLVFADIKKKHSAHAITSDVSLVETARAAELFLADGVIVTGPASGEETSPDDVRNTTRAIGLPVLVGSGVSLQNLDRFADAHGFIVGSSLKQGGIWSDPVDRTAVESMARAFAKLPRN
jgi:membrane complex biogenesis BtpA family protein